MIEASLTALNTNICTYKHTYIHTYIYICTYIDKDEASLAALDITDESHLFLWDGVSVGGEAVQVGECCEPVQLHVMYPSLLGEGEGEGSTSETEMVLGFSKNSTLREIKVCNV